MELPGLVLSLDGCDSAAVGQRRGVVRVLSQSKDLLGVCSLLLLRPDGVASVQILAGELLSWRHTNGVGPNSSGEKDDVSDCSPTPLKWVSFLWLGLQLENNSGVPQPGIVLTIVESNDLLITLESGVTILRPVKVVSAACVVTSDRLLVTVAPGSGVDATSPERSKVCWSSLTSSSLKARSKSKSPGSCCL